MPERTNEEALDLFADLLEPAAEILTDTEVMDAFDKDRIKGIKLAIKTHHSAVIEMLARIDGKDPAAYKVNLLALPARILGFFNRPEINVLFTLQDQKTASAFSGPATENTEDGVR